MIDRQDKSSSPVWVAIDVAKTRFDVLVEIDDKTRKRFKIQNALHDYHAFAEFLFKFRRQVIVGFEATGNYHRTFAYFLEEKGCQLRLISSLALARTREALGNSWDKNDPRDAQVILYMLKAGITQTFCDPLRHGHHDIQELSKTYAMIRMRKTMIQHSILNHYLPLYFPEAEKYYHSGRAEWFARATTPVDRFTNNLRR